MSEKINGGAAEAFGGRESAMPESGTISLVGLGVVVLAARGRSGRAS